MTANMSKSIHVRVDEKAFKRLEETVNKDGYTMSEFIRRLIDKELCENDPPEKNRRMTKRERTFIQSSIQKQLAEYERKHGIEMDAMILWDLHVLFGFGKNRLRVFYDHFGEDIGALIARYEDEKVDKVWFAADKLKEEMGIDIRKWAAEKEEKMVKNAK